MNIINYLHNINKLLTERLIVLKDKKVKVATYVVAFAGGGLVGAIVTLLVFLRTMGSH